MGVANGSLPAAPLQRSNLHTTPSAHVSIASLDFQRLLECDLVLLHDWLLRPHVAAWWGPANSIDELRSDYLRSVDDPSATRAYIARMDGEPIGFIQSYVVMGCGGGWWENEADPGARGIDQFLAEADQLGQGLGRAMIRAFVGRLLADPVVTIVQTDPDPKNERAIRCYIAAGFYPVGPVLTPDGHALLMRCPRRTLSRSLSMSDGPSLRYELLPNV